MRASPATVIACVLVAVAGAGCARTTTATSAEAPTTSIPASPSMTSTTTAPAPATTLAPAPPLPAMSAAPLTPVPMAPSPPPSVIVASGVAPNGSLNDQKLVRLPDGDYFGTIESFHVVATGGGAIVFDPVTWTAGATPVDHDPNTWASLPFGAGTSAEYTVGDDAASSHVVDTTFDASFGTLVKHAMAAFATDQRLGYEITVSAGQLTFIKQITAITPTSPDASFTEP